MAENEGSQSRLAVDDAGPGTLFMEFLTQGVKCYDERAHDEGIAGTRSLYASRERKTKEWVRGPLTMNPTPTELDFWLKYAFGAESPSGTFTLEETLPSFYMIEDKGDTVHEWPVCYIDTLEISGSQGQPITVVANIEGKSETKDGASFPSVSRSTDTMFVFADLVLTLGGTAYKVESFSLKIDNLLDKERWLNSVTRDEIPSQGRIVTLGISLPWDGTNDALYGIALGGIEGSLVLNNAVKTYTFTFGTLCAAKEGPDTPGRRGLRFPVNFLAKHDGTNKEVGCVKTNS